MVGWHHRLDGRGFAGDGQGGGHAAVRGVAET